MCTPTGVPAWVWFEWGPGEAYNQATELVSLGSGTAVRHVSAPVEGLAEGGIYQFRVAVSNNTGVAYGMPRRFTTGGTLRVAQWGADLRGLRISPLPITNAVAVDAGRDHGVALKSDGTVAAWGTNQFKETDVPVDLTNVVALSTYATYNLALLADSSVRAWGIPNSMRGQTNIPAGLTNVVSLAAAWRHALALTAEGKVVTWGTNGTSLASIPAGLSNVVAVAAGDEHSLALKSDGTLTAWGYNSAGQLNVAAYSNLVDVAAGGLHSVALKADGTVVAWGWNAYGQTNVPAGLSDVVAVASGSRHCLALKSDGTVVAWGAGTNTAPGYPDGGQSRVPLGMTGVVQVAAGDFNSIALAANTPPQCDSIPVTVAPGADTAFALPFWDPNGDAFACRLNTFPAAGELFQFSDGSRGALLTPGEPVVLDPQGRAIFASPPGALGWPYTTFTCQASDATSDSITATVLINVVNQPLVRIERLGVGAAKAISLSFTGSLDATYQCSWSPDLISWYALGSATQSQAGVFQFTDASVTNHPQRFYRVSCP